ncbi:MAG: acetate kinase, partial [Prolixibacteraceae bacterium]|nr:acetate kinase [Prolixibacteraceae bacterium]
MKILVLNCGSSSIKFQFFNMETRQVLAKGLVDKIGLNGSQLVLNKENGEKVIFQGEILDHKLGIEYVLGVLTSKKHGCINELSEISAVGHRVVHGGETFSDSVLITQEVISEMEKCIELAPLHNPPNLKGIEAITDLIPEMQQVGVFDTAFHQTMPNHAYMYGIPYSLYKKYGV